MLATPVCQLSVAWFIDGNPLDSESMNQLNQLSLSSRIRPSELKLQEVCHV